MSRGSRADPEIQSAVASASWAMGVVRTILIDKDACPGLRLLVTFRNDPGFWHERILLRCVFPGVWLIYTAGGDLYMELSKGWCSLFYLSGGDG